MPAEAPICADLPATKSYFNLKQDVHDDSLRNVLERPIVIATGTFSSTPQTTLVTAFNSVTDFRANFTNTQWDRLLGYLGVRFTLNFTVVVSKTAFNQGVISVNWQYGVGNNNKSRANFFPLSVNTPHARLNIAEGTMMELSVPFICAEEYIRVTTVLGSDVYPYGIMSLVNLTGCPAVSGQSFPTYTIYLSLTDVELIGHQPIATSLVTVQSGTQKRAVMSKPTLKHGDVAKEGKAKGVLSSTTRSLSNIAHAAGYVPGLGAVAGTADWLLRGATGALEAFGYSKPLDETKPQRVTRSAYAGDGQTDIPDVGYPLAPFASNKLAIDGTLGCNDEDQMALDYVLSKYSYIYRGALTTLNAPGDVIYTSPVTPSAFYYRDVALSALLVKGNTALKTASLATENAMLPSTLCYVSDNFRYWRGNIKFRITFAATKLHGGRVLFSFVPQRFNAGLAPGGVISTTRAVPQVSVLGPNPTGDGVIFDLQDSSTFEFEVPFVYPNTYCGVLSEYIGDVSMVVVAPLSANVSVPSTVNFMVEVCAMPGFELACVCPSMMAPVPAAGITTVSFQSGMAPVTVESEASQQTMGEVIKSLKTLIQMKDHYTLDLPVATTLTYSLDPWFKPNSPALSTPMSSSTLALYFGAKSSRIAELYSFVRGSTSYVVYKDNVGIATHRFYWAGDDGGVIPTTFYSMYDKANIADGIVSIPETVSTSRVVIPTYAKIPRIPLEVRDSGFGAARTGYNRTAWNTAVTLAQPLLSLRNGSGIIIRVMIGRAAADDAMMSQYVGPPPTILLNSLQSFSPASVGLDF